MTRAQRHNGAQPSGLQQIPAEDSVPESYATHPARRGAWRRVRTDVRLHLVESETLQPLYSWNNPPDVSESCLSATCALVRLITLRKSRVTT